MHLPPRSDLPPRLHLPAHLGLEQRRGGDGAPLSRINTLLWRRRPPAAVEVAHPLVQLRAGGRLGLELAAGSAVVVMDGGGAPHLGHLLGEDEVALLHPLGQLVRLVRVRVQLGLGLGLELRLRSGLRLG